MTQPGPAAPPMPVPAAPAMPVPFLDLTAQYDSLRSEVDAAIADVLATQRFILGPQVEALETEVAAFVGSPHAIACASGTDALLLALRALELQPGDEVVVPAFTFFACAGAVWNAGLRPVFADVDPDSFNLTAETVRAVLTDRTRAIVLVHLYGLMAEMEPILELAGSNGLTVVEDAAQSFGARRRVAGEWRHAGAVGRVGCYSFFPTKVLGAYGDAGMIVTGDAALADRLLKLRVHGGLEMYHHEYVGTNSRLDALQAAVLRVKLPRVPVWLEARRRLAAAYGEALAPLQPRVVTPSVPEGPEHACNVYTIRAERRDDLREHLTERGIGTSVYYPLPLHLQECFGPLGYRRGDLPVSERLAGEVLSLPIYPELDEAAVEEVASALAAFYR